MSPTKAQPKGLYLLFMTETWERFSFYAMRALLVLYMTAVIEQGGLGWSNEYALKIYGYYLGFAYITPVLGGYLADAFLGQRRSVLIGGLLMALGHALMAINDLTAFYAALFLISLGNGFFKPNVTSILGGLYETNDPRRDAGYAIFYMGINLGGALAGFVAGRLQQVYGFDAGFIAAAVAMLLGLIVFWWAQKTDHLGDVGCHHQIAQKKKEKLPLTSTEVDRIGVIFALTIAVLFFIIAFEQAGGLLNLFASKWTDRHFFGYEVPAAYFQSLNPIFVVLMSPFASMLWTRLGARNPFMSTKVAIGLLLTAAGFVVLWMVTPCDVVESECGCHSFWLIPFNALVTAGEICILPVVWSAVSKLAPRQYASSLMAIALFAIGVGGWIAGAVGSMVDDMGPSSIFSLIAIICTIMAAVMLFVTPMLRQKTHGIE